MKAYTKLSKEQMQSIEGGKRNKLLYFKDVNGDGKLDQVIRIYDEYWGYIKTTVIYG